jgi:Putative prokaryotic signal transducing protein
MVRAPQLFSRACGLELSAEVSRDRLVRRVASNESLAFLGHLRNLLEQSGIQCLIKNEQLSGGLGEIPFLECLPELWILRDDQLPAAESLLTEIQHAVAPSPAWHCPACGELNEGQFAACWHCGRPDERE